jgi:hypothetical protein
VLAASPDADLLVLRPQVGARLPPTRGAQRILRERPVAVLFDGSDGASHALTTAIHIARTEGRDLVVLLAASDAEGKAKTARALESSAVERLRDAGMRPRYQVLTRAHAARLIEAVRRVRAAVLVVPQGATPLGPQDLGALLGAIGCPLVLAR